MAQLSDCIMTSVKNVSGGELRLMWLPPHGRTLADDEEYTFAGDLVSAIRSKFGGDYVGATRSIASLQSALENGLVEVIKTPAPILYDPTLDTTKQLKLDNGVLYTADPCWLATSSSAAV